ncbi:MAG: WG repeat-containing protein [Firmicutes bacterium]|nr:WG repeat-containing protein [Bacillota bacterium]
MNKRILTICLALALCLSLIPVTAFAAVPLYTYQEIKTGVSATDISMLDNGYGSFKTKADDGELISKGVISPSGKVVLTRTPGENDPRYNMIDVSTNYASAGSVIADLLPVYDGPADTMMGEDFDFNLYSTDGKLITSAKKIIAAYEKMSEDDIVCSMTAYFGSDGYLTVFGNPDGYNVYAYIIDPQTQKVVFKQWSYEDTPRMGGESWNITSVNDGLIAYNHGESKESDAGYYGYEYIAAGWMDINGKHKISINTDKYSNWWNFSSDRAMVSNVTGLWYGYVDKTGKEVIPCKYSDGSMFKDGYAYVKEEDGRVGYIDTAGKTIIPFNYEYAFGYGDGLFTVGHAGQYDNYYGMVDINNTEVVPTVGYTDISVAKNGIAYAIKDDEIVILKFTKDEAAAKDVSNIFKDVPSNAWYKKYLQNAYDSKIITGTSATTYTPTANLNHGQIMVMAANLHSRMKGDNYDFQANKKAGDPWYKVFQDYCKAEGIIDERFDEGITANVTRAERAFYFARTLDDSYYKDKQTITFTDMPENGYDEYIMKLAKADIVGGKGEGKYDPSGLITRAEAAVFISNILDAIAENSTAGR